MFKKKKTNKRFKGSKRTTYEPTYDKFIDNSTKNGPVKKEEHLEMGLNNIALRDLPKSAYALQISSYDELNEAATSYPFIAPYNKHVTASYAGYTNLEGGKTSQYLTSPSSSLLHVVDAMTMEVGVNYRFLNLRPDRETLATRGSRILRLMYDAAAEALAQLDATSFMELELVKSYVIGTTVPIQDLDPAKTVEIKSDPEAEEADYVIYFYTDPAAVIVLFSIEYQTLLQQTVSNFNAYNKYMSYTEKMLQMNYNREIPVLNDLFGQLKKVGFVTKLDTISLSLQAEWLDVDWAQQNNITANQVSRKSNAMIDPVLELNTVYNLFDKIYTFADNSGSKIEVSKLEDTYSDLASLKAAIDSLDVAWIWNTDNRNCRVRIANSTYPTYDYTALSRRINNYFSITETLRWSRKAGLTDSDTMSVEASARFNEIVWTLDAINTIVGRIKTQFGDLRTIYEKLAPTGIINYKRGVKLVRTAVYDLDFKHYLTVEDIFKTVATGVNTITFNASIGRWQSVALWDKTYGIPLFDAKNGGSFLTFCTKGLGPKGVEDESTANVDLIPCIFTYNQQSAGNHIRATNRLGDEIQYKVRTANALDSNTARLAILPSQNSYLLHLPELAQFNDVANLQALSNIDKSYLSLAMVNALGCYYNLDGHVDYSSDIIAFYEYQIIDISNPMISYAKAYGPVKGTDEKPGFIGFAGLTGTARK